MPDKIDNHLQEIFNSIVGSTRQIQHTLGDLRDGRAISAAVASKTLSCILDSITAIDKLLEDTDFKKHSDKFIQLMGVRNHMYGAYDILNKSLKSHDLINYH